MQVQYAFSPTMLPVGAAGAVDLLVRFRPPAPDAASAAPRRPLNLSLVIDRSGSMAGHPLRNAIQAAEDLLERLGPEDILSVVTYDDHIDTIVPPQPVTDKPAIRAALHRVRAGGTTNLSGGWLKGCEHVLANLGSGDRINRVLLLTDGQANAGVTDVNLLVNTARQKAEAGVATTTLGFGNHFNEDLLIGMARAGGGNFYYIQSPDDAGDVFRIELDSLKSVVAQNLTATITTAPGVTVSVAASGLRTATNAQGLTITLGDVYENEDRLLALDVTVPSPASIGSLPLLTLNYTFDRVTGSAIESAGGDVAVALPIGTIEEAASAAPATELVVEISRIRIARAKDEAVERADSADFAGAAQLLRDVIETLRRKGLQERFEIAEEMDQLEHYAQRIERRQMGTDIRKELRDQSYQAGARTLSGLSQRGLSTGTDAVLSLPVVTEPGDDVELECFREGGKLRIRVISDGYDPGLNVQFPRAIRADSVRYVAGSLELSADGTFYRAAGEIRRLLRPGEPDLIAQPQRSTVVKTGRASVAPPTAADLETTDTVGDGVLVQCIKDGSKLRARVVSDGYDPNWNMRFPRSIREEGTLYVVDEVTGIAGGGQYQACGKIKRFVQPK